LQWSLNIESDIKNIDLVRSLLEKIFVQCELDLVHFNKVFLGVSEAVSNCIKHGNQLVKSKKVYIDALCDKESLMFTVKDEGIGFDFSNVADPTVSINIRKDSGRGIFIMRNIASEVSYFEGGTKVSIKFILEQ